MRKIRKNIGVAELGIAFTIAVYLILCIFKVMDRIILCWDTIIEKDTPDSGKPTFFSIFQAILIVTTNT